MKAFTLALAALAGFVAALPAQVEERQTPYVACSGLYGTSQCCATDVLGVADLDCANRRSPIRSRTRPRANFVKAPSVPTSAANFQTICSDVGQRARCCVLPLVSILLSQ